MPEGKDKVQEIDDAALDGAQGGALGDGSVRTLTPSIKDGTSNIIRDGTSNISDGTSNTIIR